MPQSPCSPTHDPCVSGNCSSIGAALKRRGKGTPACCSSQQAAAAVAIALFSSTWSLHAGTGGSQAQRARPRLLNEALVNQPPLSAKQLPLQVQPPLHHSPCIAPPSLVWEVVLQELEEFGHVSQPGAAGRASPRSHAAAQREHLDRLPRQQLLRQPLQLRAAAPVADAAQPLFAGQQRLPVGWETERALRGGWGSEEGSGWERAGLQNILGVAK